MKLAEYKSDFYHFTGKLSDINRQIAFAGIALIWIFKKTNGTQITICDELELPAILLAVGLGFDILQYIYQSITWAIFYRYHEKKNSNPDLDILASPVLNYPSWTFFILKVLSVIVSYVFIVKYLIENLIV